MQDHGAEGPDGRVPGLGRPHAFRRRGIAAHYDGLLDGLVPNERAESLPTLRTDVEMGDPATRRRVARETLAFACARAD